MAYLRILSSDRNALLRTAQSYKAISSFCFKTHQLFSFSQRVSESKPRYASWKMNFMELESHRTQRLKFSKVTHTTNFYNIVSR